MTDCTGYGFHHQVDLCLSGPVGDGQTADLTVTISNIDSPNLSQSFNSSKSHTVPGWDGTRIEIDVSSLLSDTNYSFGNSCNTISARLTLTPDGDGAAGGVMLLELILDDCQDNATYPLVYENCGGTGPHIVSQMSTFSFSGAACPP